MNEALVAGSDRRIFYILDHLMSSRRNRLISTDTFGRLSAMASQKLIVRRFMKSTFKTMISCSGGIFIAERKSSLWICIF